MKVLVEIMCTFKRLFKQNVVISLSLNQIPGHGEYIEPFVHYRISISAERADWSVLGKSIRHGTQVRTYKIWTPRTGITTLRTAYIWLLSIYFLCDRALSRHVLIKSLCEESGLSLLDSGAVATTANATLQTDYSTSRAALTQSRDCTDYNPMRGTHFNFWIIMDEKWCCDELSTTYSEPSWNHTSTDLVTLKLQIGFLIQLNRLLQWIFRIFIYNKRSRYYIEYK